MSGGVVEEEWIPLDQVVDSMLAPGDETRVPYKFKKGKEKTVQGECAMTDEMVGMTVAALKAAINRYCAGI
eukprot:COSAG02_NODE_1916_length_10389_cov_4.419922_10_plen_71_part_00